MKFFGESASDARSGLTGGSTAAAWRRAGVLAVVLFALVLVLAPGVPKASGVFQPTVTFQTSTTQAAAHPDLRITVDNTASDFDNDIASLSFQLPDGFWGSLDAAVPCKWDSTGDAAHNAVDGTCESDAKIGTVTASADVRATDGDPSSPVSDMTLSGDVFLTDPSTANAATDPAGLTVVVDAKVGGVNLGKVIVHARAIPQYMTLSGAAYVNLPAGTLGPPIGLMTQVDDVPNEVTDTAHTPNRTVKFHMTKMVVDLKSDQSPPRQPLLTNPSRCAANPSGTPAVFHFTSSFTSTAGGSPVAPTPQDYSVTNCDAVERGTSSFTTTLSDVTPGAQTSAIVDIAMNPNVATARKVVATLPSMLQLNAGAYGGGYDTGSPDQCNGTSIASVSGLNPVRVFNPGGTTPCPDRARFGTIKVWTPLLPDPLVGYTYWVTTFPLPKIGVWISPATDPGNPKGVTLSMVGEPAVKRVPSDSPSCNNPYAASCDQALSITFDGLPSAPVTRIQIDTYRADRPALTADGNQTLDKDVLAVAGSSDTRCQKTSDMSAQFYYYSSTSLVENFGEVADPLSFPGCNQADPAFVTNSSSPIGAHTTDASPTFEFGSGVSGNCAVDFVTNVAEDPGPPAVDPVNNYNACTSTYASTDPFAQATNPLSVGLHHFFFTPDGGNEFVRSFVIDPPAHETTAPTVTFDSGPSGDTSDTTPSFAFHADEASLFQCSLDDGAYQPCTNTTTLDTDGSFDVADALGASDDDHTLDVRASDSFGNVGTPASRTFKIVIPFDPGFQVDLSTDVARAHPDMDLTITNNSHEDVKDLSFSLPDGFFGGLTGVGTLCPLTDADAGTCPSSSQVGTVEAEAAIDRSTVRNTGVVYLTESRDPATEPASLSIKLHPAVQDVEFDDIIVTAHLKVRGVAQGIDTFALNLPYSADNQYNEYSEFDLRKMVLKLRTGPGATYPLLTNPSYCGPMSFEASFTGYGLGANPATTAAANQPFQASGCGSLPFAPALGISMVDAATGKPAGPSNNIKRVALNVSAGLTSSPDQAGIQRVRLVMPHPVTIDVQKLPAPCSLAEAAAKACPPAAAIGTVTATSPLLREPLTGTVFMLRADPATPTVALPRLMLALRGAINVDVIGTNSFVNQNQIVTDFSVLPDVPLSGFAININNFLTTRNDACDWGPEDWNVTGTLTGFNGSVSSVVIPEQFNCATSRSSTASYKFKRKGNRSAFSATVTAKQGTKLKKLAVTLPSGLKFRKSTLTKKRLARFVKVKADGRTVKSSCLRRMSSKRFQINFCKRSASRITITFRSGSVIASKHVSRRPHFRMIAKDTRGKMSRVERVGG